MMLEQLTRKLGQFHPQRSVWKLPEAAVLIPITQSPSPEIIMTRRADHLNTHGGQVAFPGGKRDTGDADLAATALREAEEETGLRPSQVQLLGRLSERISLHGIKVTPYVGLIPSGLILTPSENELDAIFRVPLDWLLQDPRSHTDVIQAGPVTFYVPSYPFGDYVIWGLSAMMLVELLQVGFNMDIDLHRKPAGKLVQRPIRPLPLP